MAGKGKKNQKKGCMGTAGTVIVLILEFIALFFMALGSPYDVLKMNDDQYVGPDKECYSVWGRKHCGGSHATTWHDDFYKFCGVFEATMKAAASFTIISIGLMGFNIIASISLLCKCLGTKVPIILLAFFGLICSAVPWAAICGLYYNSTCGSFIGKMKDRSSFGAGFAFLIVGFAIQFFVFLFACLI